MTDSRSRPKEPVGATLFPLAPAHLTGIGAIQLAMALWLLVSPLWSLLPLGTFLLACIVAPFVQRWQFFLPIVTRGNRRRGAVAFTFDDGPDPLTTPHLLDLLTERNLRVTFFVVGRNVRAHPDLLRMILDRGHEIGSHSDSHDLLLMFRGSGRLRREVQDCQKTLELFGVRPVAFRPPVGVTSPRLWRVLLESGMYCAGFRRRARDLGNLRVRGIAGRILKRLRAGDVVLLHDCRPWKEGDVGRWLGEIRELMDGVAMRGLEIQPLSRVISRPVMEPLSDRIPANPVSLFYDSLAWAGEPDNRSASARAEQAWFLSVEESISPEARILEVGAGTGRFTLRLARRAREVLAVDVSAVALETMRSRALERGLGRIRTIHGDIRDLPLSGPFDVVCSFSVFEYVADLQSLLAALVKHLEPGGRLIFSTAHRSFFRFFAQLGNAMRQGMWLHARTTSQVERILRALDMEDISLSTLGMKSPVNGGLLLTASARKKNLPSPSSPGVVAVGRGSRSVLTETPGRDRE